MSELLDHTRRAVLTEDLGALLDQAVAHDRDTLSRIAERAELPRRTVQRIAARDSATTHEDVAEKILVAIGETAALISGEVRRVAQRTPARPPRAQTLASSGMARMQLSDLIDAGFLRPEQPLVLRYRGDEYTAVVTGDGSIRLPDDRTFDTPSQASQAVKCIRADSGWDSWLVEEDGVRVSLAWLRKRLREQRQIF